MNTSTRTKKPEFIYYILIKTFSYLSFCYLKPSSNILMCVTIIPFHRGALFLFLKCVLHKFHISIAVPPKICIWTLIRRRVCEYFSRIQYTLVLRSFVILKSPTHTKFYFYPLRITLKTCSNFTDVLWVVYKLYLLTSYWSASSRSRYHPFC